MQQRAGPGPACPQPINLRRARVWDDEKWCYIQPGQSWRSGEVISPKELKLVSETKYYKLLKVCGGGAAPALAARLPRSVGARAPPPGQAPASPRAVSWTLLATPCRDQAALATASMATATGLQSPRGQEPAPSNACCCPCRRRATPTCATPTLARQRPRQPVASAKQQQRRRRRRRSRRTLSWRSRWAGGQSGTRGRRGRARAVLQQASQAWHESRGMHWAVHQAAQATLAARVSRLTGAPAACTLAGRSTTHHRRGQAEAGPPHSHSPVARRHHRAPSAQLPAASGHGSAARLAADAATAAAEAVAAAPAAACEQHSSLFISSEPASASPRLVPVQCRHPPAPTLLQQPRQLHQQQPPQQPLDL
jgi:hypothetical protein